MKINFVKTFDAICVQYKLAGPRWTFRHNIKVTSVWYVIINYRSRGWRKGDVYTHGRINDFAVQIYRISVGTGRSHRPRHLSTVLRSSSSYCTRSLSVKPRLAAHVRRMHTKWKFNAIIFTAALSLGKHRRQSMSLRRQTVINLRTFLCSHGASFVVWLRVVHS